MNLGFFQTDAFDPRLVVVNPSTVTRSGSPEARPKGLGLVFTKPLVTGATCYHLASMIAAGQFLRENDLLNDFVVKAGCTFDMKPNPRPQRGMILSSVAGSC
jgi:hypothetical protein